MTIASCLGVPLGASRIQLGSQGWLYHLSILMGARHGGQIKYALPLPTSPTGTPTTRLFYRSVSLFPVILFVSYILFYFLYLVSFPLACFISYILFCFLHFPSIFYLHSFYQSAYAVPTECRLLLGKRAQISPYSLHAYPGSTAISFWPAGEHGVIGVKKGFVSQTPGKLWNVCYWIPFVPS